MKPPTPSAEQILYGDFVARARSHCARTAAERHYAAHRYYFHDYLDRDRNSWSGTERLFSSGPYNCGVSPADLFGEIVSNSVRDNPEWLERVAIEALHELSYQSKPPGLLLECRLEPAAEPDDHLRVLPAGRPALAEPFYVHADDVFMIEQLHGADTENKWLHAPQTSTDLLLLAEPRSDRPGKHRYLAAIRAMPTTEAE